MLVRLALLMALVAVVRAPAGDCIEHLTGGPLPVGTYRAGRTPFFRGGPGVAEIDDPPIFSARVTGQHLRALVRRMGPFNQIEIFDQEELLEEILGAPAVHRLQEAAEALVFRGARQLSPRTETYFATAFLRWNTTRGGNAGSRMHRDGHHLTILKRLHRPERQRGTVVEEAPMVERALDPTKVTLLSGSVPHRAGPKPPHEADFYLQIRLGDRESRESSQALASLGNAVVGLSRAQLAQQISLLLYQRQYAVLRTLLAIFPTYRFDLSLAHLVLFDGRTLYATLRDSNEPPVQEIFEALRAERRRRRGGR